MRHKYSTRALVLARTPLGEANGLLTILTADLGLLRARAQGIRKPGAKLAAALATYAESTLTLVRGQEGWRITGATLEHPWFRALAAHPARERAARVTGLVVRLVAGEAADVAVFPRMVDFFSALSSLPSESHEAAECLAALSVLAALGLDAGSDLPGSFDASFSSVFSANRAAYISRINRGIEASGL
jgi:DNA repair protein RecO (recombination protein O)